MSPAEQEDLAEVKRRAYDLMGSHLAAMHDVIEAPDVEREVRLRNCGHRTLESFLVSTIRHVHREQVKLFEAHERKWP